MITIIIPIFNTADYLSQCLDSIRQQTYTDLQVVMVDDGSTDQSALIAEQFATEDKRFQLIKQSNHGQAAARNRAMELIQGDYVCFIDSDDYIDNDYIATLANAAEGCDIVQSGYRRVTDEKVIKTDIPRNPYRLTSACFRLYNTQWLKQQTISFAEGHVYEDVLFSVDVWQKNPRINIIHYAGYNYRLNNTSTTSKQHNTKYLFEQLHKRLISAKSLRNYAIVIYTMLRLRTHFLLHR